DVAEAADAGRCELICAGGAVAELAKVVVAPAAGGAVGQERAGVSTPGRNGHRVEEAGDEHRGEPVYGGAVAELTVVVLAPAAGGAVGQERARVPLPGRNGHRVGEADDGHRGEPICAEGAVAELAKIVVAPAAGGAVDQERASVRTPG